MRHEPLNLRRVFDPFFAYPYLYAYPPDYMAENFGYLKIKADRKDASVYVDGGFADKVEKAKKFALRPGNHEIELRDSDGRTLYKEQVAVIVRQNHRAACWLNRYERARTARQSTRLAAGLIS